MYRAGESHWYQRLYGLFNGQLAFGDDWLPITDWVEQFLSALLRWPGCRIPEDFDWVEHGIQETLLRISERISLLESKVGSSTKTLLLPMIAKWPTASKPTRPLRACIVQTAIPREEDFEKPISCSPSPLFDANIETIYRPLLPPWSVCSSCGRRTAGTSSAWIG